MEPHWPIQFSTYDDFSSELKQACDASQEFAKWVESLPIETFRARLGRIDWSTLTSITSVVDCMKRMFIEDTSRRLSIRFIQHYQTNAKLDRLRNDAKYVEDCEKHEALTKLFDSQLELRKQAGMETRTLKRPGITQVMHEVMQLEEVQRKQFTELQ